MPDPGERIVMFRRRDYSGERLTYYIAGVLLLPVLLVGVIFFVLAQGLEQKNPRAVLVTTWRLVVIGPQGQITSYWLRDVGNLDPVKPQVRASGGGLLGAVISVAVVAGMDALAARNPKTQPGFWARSSGVRLYSHQGVETIVDLPQEAAQVGVTIAQLMAGMGDQLRTVDPAFAAAQAVPVPGAKGRPLRIVGACLLPVGCFLAFRTVGLIFRRDDLADVPGNFWVILVAGIVLMLASAALFAVGTLQARKGIADGSTPKRPLLLGNLAYGGIAAATVGLGLVFVIDAAMVAADREDRVSSRGTSGTSKGGTSPTTSGATSPWTQPRILSVIAKNGLRVENTDVSDVGKAPFLRTGAYRGSAPHVAVMLGDFSGPPRVDGSSVTAYGISTQHGVSVEISGPTAASEAPALRDALVAAPLGLGRAQVTAALTSRGWKVDPIDPDGDYIFCFRRVLAFGSKGGLNLTLYVLDFKLAADKQKSCLVRAGGGKFVVVDGEYAGPGEAEAILAAIVAP